MAQGIAGKLLRVKFDDKYIKCQLDATVNFITNTTEDDPCKPDGNTVEDTARWIEREVETQDLNITVNHRSFLDAVGAELTQSDIIDLIVGGNLYGVAEVLTTPGQHNNDEDVILEVPVVITDFSWNLPASGKANSDLTLSGNGKPTYDRIPAGS